MDMYARLYLKWITNRALLQSTGNSAQCYVAARMGGEFGGRMDYISFFCLPKTTTTLLIGYTPIQNKKLKKYCCDSNKQGLKDKYLIPLTQATQSRQIHGDRKQNGGGQGLGGGENGELLFSQYRISLWDNAKVLEIANSDGHKTL